MDLIEKGRYREMTKKGNEIIRNILMIVAVVVVIFWSGYYFGWKSNLPKVEVVEQEKASVTDMLFPWVNEKRTIQLSQVEARLEGISELSTMSGEYTVTKSVDESRYLFEKVKIWGTKNTIDLKCNGIVKIGYDMSEISIDKKEGTLYISLPEPKLHSNYIIWDDVICNEKNNLFNPIEFQQYQQLIREIKAEGLQKAEAMSIYKKADERVKELIEVFLADIIASGYEIVYM